MCGRNRYLLQEASLIQLLRRRGTVTVISDRPCAGTEWQPAPGAFLVLRSYNEVHATRRYMMQ